MRRIRFFNRKRLPDFAAAPTSTELGYEIALLQRRVLIARVGTEPEKITLLSAALARVAVNPDHKALLKQSLAVDVNYMPTREAFAIMHNDLDEMRKIVQAPAKS
jgi:tripartite-type tricarboxylate transporter receptor subunit TctC